MSAPTYRVTRGMGDRWLVVRPVPGLPINSTLHAICDCATREAAEKAREWHEANDTPAPLWRTWSLNKA